MNASAINNWLHWLHCSPRRTFSKSLNIDVWEYIDICWLSHIFHPLCKFFLRNLFWFKKQIASSLRTLLSFSPSLNIDVWEYVGIYQLSRIFRPLWKMRMFLWKLFWVKKQIANSLRSLVLFSPSLKPIDVREIQLVAILHFSSKEVYFFLIWIRYVV